jgi:hypothetical protein
MLRLSAWHRGCFERAVPDRSGDVLPLAPFIMKHSSEFLHDEPVGIVISGGQTDAEPAPRFSAYIWAPAPEDESMEEVQAA